MQLEIDSWKDENSQLQLQIENLKTDRRNVDAAHEQLEKVTPSIMLWSEQVFK